MDEHTDPRQPSDDQFSDWWIRLTILLAVLLAGCGGVRKPLKFGPPPDCQNTKHLSNEPLCSCEQPFEFNPQTMKCERRQ